MKRKKRKGDDRILPEGYVKRIHVNQHVIKRNRKEGTNDPTITVKSSVITLYGSWVKIHGPSVVVYRPDKPLSCGAHVWIETMASVEVCSTEVE